MSHETTARRSENEARQVERVYAILARAYDGGFDWALGPGRRKAIGRLPIEPGDRVLEVGVGTGLSLPHYPSGAKVLGIDISEPMLDQARRRADALELDTDLRRMDARDLSLANDTFDHVLAPYVISVVPEPERVMQEIRRVCRPGGTVIVVNHFRSDNPLLRGVETALTPLTRWIGFRMDLARDLVRQTPGLELVHEETVNLFGLWRLMQLRRLP